MRPQVVCLLTGGYGIRPYVFLFWPRAKTPHFLLSFIYYLLSFNSNAKTAKGFPRPLAVAYSAFVRLLVLCGPVLGQLGALGNGQAEQVDKAVGVCLIVVLVLAEGGRLLIVQGVRAGDTGVDHVALV